MFVKRSIVLLVLALGINADNPCETPNGQNGDCKPINQCPSLYKYFGSGGISTASADYLARSQCGFLGVYPKVCCPIGSSLPPPSTRKILVNKNLLPDVTVCGISTEEKIYGGEVADIDEFPWMALLMYRGANGQRKFLCGGSLINKRYVMTAAHCILSNLVGVRLGEHNLETEKDCVQNEFGKDCAPPHVDVPVEDKIIYPSDTNRYHDIALLRLSREVEYSDFIKPICLPITNDEILNSYLGQNLTVAGWGLTEKKKGSSLKLKVQVPVKELSECEAAYEKMFPGVALNGGYLCAGGEKGKDACRGDSGGPLMTMRYTKSVPRWYAIGLVSSGPIPCGREREPGVYVKVAKYVSWIVGQLKP